MIIMICDDNQENASCLAGDIRMILGTETEIQVVNNGAELLEALKYGREPDILFLDIELGDCIGITLAKSIQKQYPAIRLIFITGYIQYVQDVFQVNPVYLLLKPICQEKLKDALQKAIAAGKRQPEKLAVMEKGKIVRLDKKNIRYAESNRRVVSLFVGNAVYQVYMRMDDLEKQLPEEFIRSHQSYLVNIHYIQSFSAKGITLLDGVELPVSKYRYKEAKRKFVDYLFQLGEIP